LKIWKIKYWVGLNRNWYLIENPSFETKEKWSLKPQLTFETHNSRLAEKKVQNTGFDC
jgi:hypothetical protein